MVKTASMSGSSPVIGTLYNPYTPPLGVLTMAHMSSLQVGEDWIEEEPRRSEAAKCEL